MIIIIIVLLDIFDINIIYLLMLDNLLDYNLMKYLYDTN